jgi:hypothetical protein
VEHLPNANAASPVPDGHLSILLLRYTTTALRRILVSGLIAVAHRRLPSCAESGV